ncbi:MAG: DUF2177 family protein [Alphaproteobacteria bacterium]|nr:DUF2177 family protein [Alphaproteobacteria bacterium]
MHYVRFLAAFVVYTVIDVGWNVSPIAMGMYESLYEASGNDALLDQFGRKMDSWGVEQILALLVFLGLIALGNSYLAIEPALKENNLIKAMKNSFVLGCAAYATYIVPIFLMLKTWPTILVPIDILIGGLLSLITSTVVTYIVLRRRNKAESTA